MNTIKTYNHNSKLRNIFRRKHLSFTESRARILSQFLNSNDALTHSDIDKNAGEKVDRVTVYRTLQTFVDKGIIHSIPTADNTIRYALCKDCTEDHHHDDHVHFICSICNTTICLDDVVSPKINLPAGYLADNVQVVINGICKNCSS